MTEKTDDTEPRYRYTMIAYVEVTARNDGDADRRARRQLANTDPDELYIDIHSAEQISDGEGLIRSTRLIHWEDDGDDTR